MYEYINEFVEVKGNTSSLFWIMRFLAARNISFTYDAAMTKHLFFVQNTPADRTCGILSPLQYIIENCPYKGWDIASQFQCSYSDIQSR